MNWKIPNINLLIGEYNITLETIKNDDILAMFDLDNTLIKTKSGNVFPKNKDDWKYNMNVEKKIEEYITNQTKIIIITNQKKIKTEKNMIEFKQKIEDISNKISEFIIFVSLGESKYRKPITGIFEEYFIGHDKNKMFYCGDACGRANDYSDTDLKFAKNWKINFYTPEHIFDNSENNYGEIQYPKFPKIQQKKYKLKKLTNFIILVGYPGSGKTNFAQNYLQEYMLVSYDKQKNKFKKHLEEIAKTGQKIVVDNTNSSKTNRKKIINIAQQNNYAITCIHINTNKEIAKHNNYYRMYKYNQKIIPEIAYRIYSKNYEEPNYDEGYKNIVTLKFKLNENINQAYFTYLF